MVLHEYAELLNGVFTEGMSVDVYKIEIAASMCFPNSYCVLRSTHSET